MNLLAGVYNYVVIAGLLAASIPLSNQITDFLNHEKINHIFKLADVYVMPNGCLNGGSLCKLLEY